MSTELTPAVALAAAEPERERIARIFRNGNGHRQRDAVLRDELLGELVDRLQGRLVRYLTYLVGRRETAEDLAQETWLRVLERGRQYDGRLPFEPWLFAIARHLAIDLLRRHSRAAPTSPPWTTTASSPCRRRRTPRPSRSSPRTRRRPTRYVPWPRCRRSTARRSCCASRRICRCRTSRASSAPR